MGIFDIFKKRSNVCPKCGYANDADARSCAVCGYALSRVDPQATTDAPVVSDIPDRSSVDPRSDVPTAIFVADPTQKDYDKDIAPGMYDGDTMILDAIDIMNDETTIPGDYWMPPAFLVNQETSERVDINRPRFVIGRSVDNTDYCITGHSAVSRSHAAIVLEDGRWFVVDLGSLNKTWLDGRMLEAGLAAELFSGAVIRVADVEFVFSIE